VKGVSSVASSRRSLTKAVTTRMSLASIFA
jgi:hypothetical protein